MHAASHVNLCQVMSSNFHDKNQLHKQDDICLKRFLKESNKKTFLLSHFPSAYISVSWYTHVIFLKKTRHMSTWKKETSLINLHSWYNMWRFTQNTHYVVYSENNYGLLNNRLYMENFLKVFIVIPTLSHHLINNFSVVI